MQIKAAAGQDVALELLEGSLLVREAAAAPNRSEPAADARWLLERADALSDSTPIAERVERGARRRARAR